jgi:hypothetical protein
MGFVSGHDRGAHAVPGSRAEAGERTTGFSARVRTHPSRELANPPRRKAAPTCGFSSRKHSSCRARRQQISSRAHSSAPALRHFGETTCKIGNKQLSWNERDGVGPGELWRGHRRITLRGKGVGNEKNHDGEFAVRTPFFGTNPLDGAQPALNEWFGLYVSTQDHAQADQRTLADIRGLIPWTSPAK